MSGGTAGSDFFTTGLTSVLPGEKSPETKKLENRRVQTRLGSARRGFGRARPGLARFGSPSPANRICFAQTMEFHSFPPTAICFIYERLETGCQASHAKLGAGVECWS